MGNQFNYLFLLLLHFYSDKYFPLQKFTTNNIKNIYIKIFILKFMVNK